MVIRDWCRGKRSSYDNDLEISGVAATNVLRSEGTRCIKLSRGLRSYPGIETTSVSVAQQESQFIWHWPEDWTRAESTGGIYPRIREVGFGSNQ